MTWNEEPINFDALREIAEAYLAEPEYVNNPAAYPFLPEVLHLSRGYLALLERFEESDRSQD